MKIAIFTISIVLSALIVAATGTYLIIRTKKQKKDGLPALQLMIVADSLAVLFMFLPIYYFDYFKGWNLTIIRPFLIAVHNSIRVFILDGEFDIIMESLADSPEWLVVLYSTISAILYVISPILTFSAILSLFKNAFVKYKLKTGNGKNTYVFSELNTRSLVIAKSILDKYAASGIKNPGKSVKIIFAGASEQFCEDHSDLKSDADELHAFCIEDSIDEINLRKCKSCLEFYVLGSDESQNLSQTIKLTEQYKLRKNTKVFIFSSSEAVGIMLDSIEKTNLIAETSVDKFSREECLAPEEQFILRRVDPFQLFASEVLNDIDIFEKYRAEKVVPGWNPEVSETDKDKVISVLLLGFGQHGKALLKNLIWYCQMKGYYLEVNAVDRTSGPFGSVAGFIHECPGVMDVNNNCNYEGDARYSIKFLEGVDVLTGGLDWVASYRDANADKYDEDKRDTVNRLRRTSLIFVALGDDERNIGAAIDMRRLMDKLTANQLRDELAGNGKTIDENESTVAEQFEIQSELPDIYAVVYDKSKAEALTHINGLKHYQGTYDISFIGSLNQIFAYNNIFDQENESLAFKFHAMWAKAGEEQDAYAQYETYEYLRNSSLAQAIHKTLCLKKGFIKTATPKMSEEEKKAIETLESRIEHIRWCAFVRSVGYEYSGYGKKISRNDRAKWHHDLIPYALLTEDEIKKDIKINNI